MFYAGLDIGSTMTKAVILDGGGELLGRIVQHTGPEHRRLANRVIVTLLEQVGIPFSEVAYLIATGYGRVNVPFADAQVTELTCHARGVSHFFPSAQTAIDVGGQDAKALRIKAGKLRNFVMNDKCAAGTGRFLEVLAQSLHVRLEDLGPLSLRSKQRVTVSSICTIFAQQEIVSQLSSGVPIEDIVNGVHEAIASRIARMTRSVGVEPDLVLTGGVAKNVGFAAAVERAMGMKLLIPQDSLISGAMGAALIARERFEKQADGPETGRRTRELRNATFFTSEDR